MNKLSVCFKSPTLKKMLMIKCACTVHGVECHIINWLLTKPVQSRWLDIDVVLYLHLWTLTRLNRIRFTCSRNCVVRYAIYIATETLCNWYCNLLLSRTTDQPIDCSSTLSSIIITPWNYCTYNSFIVTYMDDIFIWCDLTRYNLIWSDGSS